MKILAVNWLDLENPQAGGAEIHFFEIFRRLVNAGHDVTLIASGWKGTTPSTTIDGIEVHRFGGRNSFAIYGRGAVRHALREGSYDVLVEEYDRIQPLLDRQQKTVQILHALSTIRETQMNNDF